MSDVARAAGVSPKTVSRVVNNAPNVRTSVQERVHAAIRQLGYRPNAAARALASQRTRAIGVVTPCSSLYGPSEQLFGLERAAHEAGYSVEIAATADASAGELLSAADRLLDHGVDGVALAAPLAGIELPGGSLRGVPVVVVGDPPSSESEVLAVACDQRAGAAAAVEHLLGLGHHTVWHVSGPMSWQSARERHRGWGEALNAAGAPLPDTMEGDWSPRSGYAAGLTLAERTDVTAVFAANDQMAAGLMRAFWERGRDIPRDVSVVGFDDAPESEFLMVPLTTVRQDFPLITREAIARLVDAMVGRDARATSALIPVELVARQSSGPAPTSTRSKRRSLSLPA